MKTTVLTTVTETSSTCNTLVSPERRKALGIGAAAFLGLASQTAFGQSKSDYPKRFIKLMVPFPPGGIYHAMLSVVTAKVEPQLGQSIVIEYKPGAGGMIGTNYLANAAPDGYTIGVIGHVQAVNMATSPTQLDFAKDFIYLCGVAQSPIMLVARPDAPFRNANELLAYAKAHPGKLNFGAATSYVIDLLKLDQSLDIQYVPYKSHSDALSDLLTSRIDLSAGPMMVMAQYVKAGKALGIGVAGPRRSKLLPEVPAMTESQPTYPDASVWASLAAPKGTPADIVDRLREAFKKALVEPEVLEALASQGLDTQFAQATPDQIRDRALGDLQRSRILLARNTAAAK